MPAMRLDQEGLVLRAAVELLVEPARAAAARPASDSSDIQRQRRPARPASAAGCRGTSRAKNIDGEDEVDHQGQRRAGQERADVLQLAHARHGLARPGAPRNSAAAAPAGGGTAARRARRRCGSWCGRARRCAARRARPRTPTPPRSPTTSTCSVRQALVHQHLVDHDLEEQRRREPQQLQHRRAQQHLGEDAPVGPRRAQEPAEAEARGCRPGAAAREQQHPSAPGREELRARHDARLRRPRFVHQHALGGYPRQHQPVTGAGLGQRGQGQGVESGIGGVAQAGAQTVSRAARTSAAASSGRPPLPWRCVNVSGSVASPCRRATRASASRPLSVGRGPESGGEAEEVLSMLRPCNGQARPNATPVPGGVQAPSSKLAANHLRHVGPHSCGQEATRGSGRRSGCRSGCRCRPPVGRHYGRHTGSAIQATCSAKADPQPGAAPFG